MDQKFPGGLVKMYRSVIGFCIVLTLGLMAISCTRGPKSEDNKNGGNTGQSQAGAGTPQASQEPSAAIAQSPLTTNIGRASLAIGMARDSLKQNKSEDAVLQLKSAARQVDAALALKPRLRDEIEALRGAIDRTIATIERQGKEADSQLQELQTRVGAIKVNIQ